MNVCRLLGTMYGRDTRPTQILNFGLSVVWGVLLLLHRQGVLLLDVPPLLTASIGATILFACLSALFSLVGIVVKGKRHQVFKSFGLVLGAMLQGILANGYFSAYPPLDMMLVICLAVMLWFIGALFYIAKCEGINGKFERTR